ncbi:MAG: helix-turn-helix domain-containing protein [Clostridia bacterium]|nr:helix-turn-helix domain-containing protein [Clostridia bacterium]
MFYELKHSLAADYFQVESATNMVFPSHMHHCFELLTLREGEMQVDVDDRRYTLHPGDTLMIFPNQIHSLHCVEHSRHVLILFSPKLVSAYTKKIAAKKPEDNFFAPDPFYLDKLEQLLYRQAGILEIKGLLYDFCAAFDTDAVYKEADTSSLTLICNIFRFIEQNYTGNCTLSDLVKYTGYDYAYLSRYFKKNVGISFNDYVNQYRISQACYLLQNGEMTVLEVSNECGFNSLRSMNRNFKEQMGIPPAEYRRKFR